jgi:hypothetical protein
VVLDYDWRHVAAAVLRVYQAAIAADPRRVSAVASGVTGTAQVPADLGV